jgi:hypothetical protein
MGYNPNKRAITAEKAKELRIETKVIDLWVKSTGASTITVPDILRDWFDGKISLIVDLEELGIEI